MAIERSTMPVMISDPIAKLKTLAALYQWFEGLSENKQVRFFKDYETKYKEYQQKEQPETFARSVPKLEAHPTELPVTIGAQEKKRPLSSQEIMVSADSAIETEITVSADSAIERLRKRLKESK